MTLEEAHRLGQEHIDRVFTPGNPVVLLPDEAVEDHGWCYVFHYNTKRYLETLDSAYALGPGCGPIVVVKDNGETWMMGSADFDGQLGEYAKEHGYS